VELTGGDVDRKGAERRAQLENFALGRGIGAAPQSDEFSAPLTTGLSAGSSRMLLRLSGPGAACRPRQDRGRRLNSSQVADAWISPLTNLQPPSASGGNMYVQRSHRSPGSGAGL